MSIDIERYNYWKDLSHNIFISAYNDAIANYNQQKKLFLKQLDIEGESEAKKFIQELNNKIDEELDSEIDQEFDQIFEVLSMYMEEFYKDVIENDKNQAYEILKARFDSLVQKGATNKVNPQNIYNNLKKDIENFFSAYSITREGIGDLVKFAGYNLDTSNTDIQNQLFGYCRKIILLQLQESRLKVSTQHYKDSLKGYYRETILEKTINQMLVEMGKSVSARGAGSITNIKGEQIQYDIVLGGSGISNISKEAFSSLVNSALDGINGFSVEVSEQTQDTTIYGGIQSKSWIMPDSLKTKGGNRYWLSFGNHAEFIPESSDAYYWHAGAYNVMSNLMQVIGPYNFLFSTGDTLYYTSELLAELRQMSYVLAFSKPKDDKITSGAVAAMQHKD